MALNLQTARVIDPILTTVAQGYRNAALVGETLFPRVPVSTAGGQIIKFGTEAFRIVNARRAPGAATKRIEFEYSSEPYALVQDSLEGFVPIEIAREAARVPGIDMGQRAVRQVFDQLTLALEYEQATMARNAANYENSHKVDLAGTPWTGESSDPTANINAGKAAVRGAVGLYPNTLLLGAKAFEAVRHHPDVVERFKYTSHESVTAKMLASLWDLDLVVVGKAVFSDAAGALADVWGGDCVLAYVPSSVLGPEQPSYGYTYTLQGSPNVEQPYYERNRKSWMYPVTFERRAVITGMQAGYLIRNAA
jgi:hypothetical protein